MSRRLWDRSVFRDITHHDHKLETLRHMAPECFFGTQYQFNPIIVPRNPSKPSDVYSFAMTSFNVRSLRVNHSTA
jgi:hypothetical protein